MSSFEGHLVRRLVIGRHNDIDSPSRLNAVFTSLLLIAYLQFYHIITAINNVTHVYKIPLVVDDIALLL